MEITKKFEDYLRSLVEVKDGNTEISECFYEVEILGSTIASSGGSYKEVYPWANKVADKFRDKLIYAIQNYVE